MFLELYLRKFLDCPILEEEEESQPKAKLHEEEKAVTQLELSSESNCIIAPSQPSSDSKCSSNQKTITKERTFEQGLPLIPGLGQVLDKSTRVQVQVLEKMTSTSTSTSTLFSKVLEYKYKYFEKYLSTSTEYFRCKF